MGRGGHDGEEATPTRRFYTPAEVSQHSSDDDCWVSFLGNVYNLSSLLLDHPGKLAYPIIRVAGGDISHWFDGKTGDLLSNVDPITNLRVPYCPQGRFIHVPPLGPRTDWDCSFAMPWWKDAEKYCIGKLSRATRLIRLKNVLTSQVTEMEVPSEETINEILQRYLVWNSHASSYTWKALLTVESGELEFCTLDMEKTLEENGVGEIEPEDDVPKYDEIYIPVIHLYYEDDLTVS